LIVLVEVKAEVNPGTKRVKTYQENKEHVKFYQKWYSKVINDVFSGTETPSLEEVDPYVVGIEKRQATDYKGKPLFNKWRAERLIVRCKTVLGKWNRC